MDAVPLPRILFLPLPLWVHDYLLVSVQASSHFLSPGSDWNAPWPISPCSFCLSLSELTFFIIITSFRFVCLWDLEFLEGRNCVPLIIIPEASNSAELTYAQLGPGWGHEALRRQNVRRHFFSMLTMHLNDSKSDSLLKVPTGGS